MIPLIKKASPYFMMIGLLILTIHSQSTSQKVPVKSDDLELADSLTTKSELSLQNINSRHK